MQNRSCAACKYWQPNGTRFGGKCENPRSAWHLITTSALKADCETWFSAFPIELKDDPRAVRITETS